MKPFKHLLTTALLVTWATPFAKTTINASNATRQPVINSPALASNRLLPERFADAGSDTFTRYDRLPAGQVHAVTPRHSSSDPAWLWAWVLTMGLDWMGV